MVAWLPEHAVLCQKVLLSHKAQLGKELLAHKCICLHLAEIKVVEQILNSSW